MKSVILVITLCSASLGLGQEKKPKPKPELTDMVIADKDYNFLKADQRVTINGPLMRIFNDETGTEIETFIIEDMSDAFRVIYARSGAHIAVITPKVLTVYSSKGKKLWERKGKYSKADLTLFSHKGLYLCMHHKKSGFHRFETLTGKQDFHAPLIKKK